MKVCCLTLLLLAAAQAQFPGGARGRSVKGGKGKGAGGGPKPGNNAGVPSNRPLGKQDFKNARNLKDKPGKQTELESGKFEGDIAFGSKTLESYQQASLSEMIKQAKDGFVAKLARVGFQWPGGKVPYYVSSDFDDYERSRIADAISVFHEKTCVKFVPASGEPDYIFFIKGSGCWSYIGPQGGRQYVSIGNRCAKSGIVQHELMHVLGFFHEQSRPDRDSYIQVKLENVTPGKERNFDKYQVGVDTQGIAYDYGSVMHYGTHDFSSNGQPTIVTRNGAAIGQRIGLSAGDVQAVRLWYDCDSSCVDKYILCPMFQPYCYFAFMKEYCCKTCS